MNIQVPGAYEVVLNIISDFVCNKCKGYCTGVPGLTRVHIYPCSMSAFLHEASYQSALESIKTATLLLWSNIVHLTHNSSVIQVPTGYIGSLLYFVRPFWTPISALSMRSAGNLITKNVSHYNETKITIMAHWKFSNLPTHLQLPWRPKHMCVTSTLADYRSVGADFKKGSYYPCK